MSNQEGLTKEEKEEVRSAFIGFIKYANRYISLHKIRRGEFKLSEEEAQLRTRVEHAKELLNIKNEDLK